MSQIEYIQSNRSGHLLLYKNYVLRSHSSYNDSEYWKCVVKHCRVRVVITNNSVRKEQGTHTHPPDVEKIKRLQFYNKLKKRSGTESKSTVPSIYREEIGKAASSLEAASCLPDFKTAQKVMYRARAKALPKTLPGVDLCGQMIDGQDFPLIEEETTGEWNSFQKKEGNCSSTEQNNENPNLYEYITPDIGMQYSVNTDMETQNDASSNLSSSNIVIKQEIMETEPESNVFDEQRPSTSYEPHSESSNSNADTLTYGQCSAVTAAPSLPHGLRAMKVEPLLNYREVFPENYDTSSIAPRILNDSDPERSVRDESCHSVSNTIGSESLSNNQTSHLEFSSRIESPFVPQDSTRTSQEPSCSNDIAQLRAHLPHNLINSSHVPSRSNEFTQLEANLPQNLNDNSRESSYSNQSTQPEAPSQLSAQFRSRDRFDVFGEFIASKLRKLDTKLCATLQNAFADLLFKAELENFSNRNQNPVTQTDSISRGTPSNKLDNTHESSRKENIQPKTPSHMNSSHFPSGVNIAGLGNSSRNEITQHKIPPHSHASNAATTLINETGSESSLRNEPIQPTVTSHVESLRHLVSNFPENTSINSANQIRTSQNIVTAVPPVFEVANSPTRPIISYLPRPKDEFDTFGEFLALKLRNLDSKSYAIVQIAFVDLITKAESGILVRQLETSIFANKTNTFPSHGYVFQKNTSNYESQSQLNSVPPHLPEEVPFEIIPDMDTVRK